MMFKEIIAVYSEIHQTQRCGQVVNTPASYSGSPGLKPRPGDRLF
jgi:hypothetical protein